MKSIAVVLGTVICLVILGGGCKKGKGPGTINETKEDEKIPTSTNRVGKTTTTEAAPQRSQKKH